MVYRQQCFTEYPIGDTLYGVPTMGDRIRKAYLDAGMNRAEFARRLGVQYHQVAGWEEGRQPKPDRLNQIAEVLGKSMEWLMRGEERLDVSDADVVPMEYDEIVLAVCDRLGASDVHRDRLARLQRSDGALDEFEMTALVTSWMRKEARGEQPSAPPPPNEFMDRGKKRK